jgi:hypothetical protein
MENLRLLGVLGFSADNHLRDADFGVSFLLAAALPLLDRWCRS